MPECEADLIAVRNRIKEIVDHVPDDSMRHRFAAALVEGLYESMADDVDVLIACGKLISALRIGQ